MDYPASIVGHQTILQYLQIQLKNGTVAQTNLWIGPQHIGKSTVVHWLIYHLVCQQAKRSAAQPPCLHCQPCHRVKKDLSANVIDLNPTGEAITVEQLRQVLSSTHLSSFVTGPRCLIIHQVEQLRREAANMLLKTLEEPHDQLYWFLLADSDRRLPSTIASRAARLFFYPVPTATLAAAWPEAGSVIPLANGLPGVIQTLQSEQKAEQYLATARQWLEVLELRQFGQRQQLSQRLTGKQLTQTTVQHIVQLLSQLSHDIVLLQLRLPQAITFTTLRQPLQAISNRLTTAQACQASQLCNRALHYLRSPVQPRLLLDTLLLQLYRL